jgi:hypothetical protein
MEKATFVGAESWISLPDLADPAAKSRSNLGSAFGWTEATWFDQAGNLEAVWTLIQDDLGLMADIDSADDDQKRSAWLERVVALKAGPAETIAIPSDTHEEGSQPETNVLVDDVVAEAVKKDEPPQKKPLFKKKEDKPSDRPVPQYRGGKPGMEKLLAGVLEKTSIDEAVAQMYHNLHHNMGLTYVAMSGDRPDGILGGGSTKGMCETFANLFEKGLAEYKKLKSEHPAEAVRNGALDFEIDRQLATTKFVTRTGLSLIGSGIQGNVYLEVDEKGECLNNGFDAVNRFIFKGHWTIKVNGRNYDPIFESIDEKNADIVLDEPRNYAGGRFLANGGIVHPGKPFGASYIWVHDFKKFAATVKAMRDLYSANKKEIDGMTAGSTSLQSGLRTKTDRPSYAAAKKIVAEGVSDPGVFLKVVADGSPSTEQFSEADLAAVDKVLHLASLTP